MLFFWRKLFSMGLMRMLSGCEWEGARLSNSVSFHVILTMTSSRTANVKISTYGWLEVQNGADKEVRGYQFLEKLMKLALPPTSFELNLNLKVDLLGTGFEVNGKNLEIQRFEVGNCYGLEMTGIQVTEDEWSKWDSLDPTGLKKIRIEEFEGELTLTLRLDDSAVTKLYLESLGSTVTTWPRNLIIEGVDSDLVILADGEKDKEKGINCHKKILSERSPVFTAMFQKEWSESKDNCLEIVDMTEAGVREMLQFICARDLEEASRKCEIAVELLEAGHKYGMEDLEDAMMHLIWPKPVEWVSVDLALKILVFSRNIGGKFDKIKKTGLAILKWYAKKKPGSLMASEEYRRLHANHTQLAMELGESVLGI